MGDLPAALRSAEVCVVGAGPAGITAALALGSAGRAVVLLESGELRASHRIQALNDGDHEGAPYDGLRAILSAVWAAVDAPAKPAPKPAKTAGRTRRPLPKPAPGPGTIAIDAALHRVGLDK